DAPPAEGEKAHEEWQQNGDKSTGGGEGQGPAGGAHEEGDGRDGRGGCGSLGYLGGAGRRNDVEEAQHSGPGIAEHGASEGELEQTGGPVASRPATGRAPQPGR